MIEATAKGIVLAAIWLALAFAVFRGAVPFLWSSASDFGMLSAVIVGALGAAGLLLLADRMVGAVLAGMKEKE